VLHAYNVPINCGGVRVDPGDVLCGDEDGVVCVPHDVEADVVRFATSFDAVDAEIAQLKRNGVSPREAGEAKRRWAENSGLNDWLKERL
jgi:regulator of RNase E activity RraA